MAGDASSRAVGAPRHVTAFAPGRVNLIGEHTDYNGGLALPFAIAEGVTVRARATNGESVRAHAVDLGEDDEFPLRGEDDEFPLRGEDDEFPLRGEDDEFPLREPPGAEGWRAFVRGAVAECRQAGVEVRAADLRIAGDVPRGSGLSSSAAMEVALCLALLGLAGETCDRIALARLCARVENDWVGAQTGMLDQLASLFGAADTALRIDFRTFEIEPVPLRLGGWRFVVVDSGERHANASSGYNERREECERACELLGVETLRDADADAVAGLPQPLRARAEHVLGENERVGEAVAALRAEDLPAVGRLLDASHASLRDLYEVSTPTVERAVERLRDDGAAGARLMGGGFGGSLLGLFAPDAPTPPGAREVRPGPGAHVLSE